MNYQPLIIIATIVCLFAGVWSARAEDASFEDAAAGIHQRLGESLAELTALREALASEKIPLSQRLSELESELLAVRQEYQKTSRLLDSRLLGVANLKKQIEDREDEATFVSDQLAEYIREFETRVHIAEVQRYHEPLEAAQLAMENSALSQQELYRAQFGLVAASLDRLFDALNGTRFDGTALDDGGKLEAGTFVLVGPVGFFRSADGQDIGTVEARLGSLGPSIIEFSEPDDIEAASGLITSSVGVMPLDPTLGKAHVIESTQDTLLEHVKKGGPVMIPIFALAGAALLVGLFKWVGLVLTRNPARKWFKALLKAVADRDPEQARAAVKKIKGPTGKMLAAGVDHLGEPRELVEEVMYERVLSTRLRLQRMLPFIAITAAAAPLLGLLGTVSGIINTFNMMTAFGAGGDMKNMSGGISEALITTKFGLIVAIPALLLHAYLSRKARGIIDQMEKTAVSFVNQVLKTPLHPDDQDTNDGPTSPPTDPAPAPVADASPTPTAPSAQPPDPEPANPPEIGGGATDPQSAPQA